MIHGDSGKLPCSFCGHPRTDACVACMNCGKVEYEPSGPIVLRTFEDFVEAFGKDEGSYEMPPPRPLTYVRVQEED